MADRSLPAIYVSGDNYSIGVQIGQTMRAQIRAAYAADKRLRRVLLPLYSTYVGDQVYTELLRVGEEVVPHYIDEIRGLSVGAQIPFHHMFLLHIEDEYVILSNNKGATAEGCSSAAVGEGCSSLHVLNSETAVIAHNEDGEPALRHQGYVIHADVDATERNGRTRERYVAYVYPGRIAGSAFGVNRHGLALTGNVILPTTLTYIGRLARRLFCRALFAAQSIADVQRIIQNLPGITTAYHFNLGHVVCSEGGSSTPQELAFPARQAYDEVDDDSDDSDDSEAGDVTGEYDVTTEANDEGAGDDDGLVEEPANQRAEDDDVTEEATNEDTSDEENSEASANEKAGTDDVIRKPTKRKVGDDVTEKATNEDGGNNTCVDDTDVSGRIGEEQTAEDKEGEEAEESDGCNIEGRIRFASLEVVANQDGGSETSVMPVNEQHFYANRLLRLSANQNAQLLHTSRVREQRFRAMTSQWQPRSVDDVRLVMGDTGHSEVPMWRDGRYPDHKATCATGIFDFHSRQMLVYRGNPATQRASARFPFPVQ